MPALLVAKKFENNIERIRNRAGEERLRNKMAWPAWWFEEAQLRFHSVGIPKIGQEVRPLRMKGKKKKGLV